MVERGNPDLIKKIMRTSQESHGYTNNENNKSNSYIPESNNLYIPEPNSIITNPDSEIEKINETNKPRNQEIFTNTYSSTSGYGVVNNSPNKPAKKLNFDLSGYEDSLKDSIKLLSYNKEYSNALLSLIKLYLMDMLDKSILNSISYEDLGEIKSIIREFMMYLDR